MSVECGLIMAATFGLLLYGFEHFGGQGNSGHERVAEGRGEVKTFYYTYNVHNRLFPTRNKINFLQWHHKVVFLFPLSGDELLPWLPWWLTVTCTPQAISELSPFNDECNVTNVKTSANNGLHQHTCNTSVCVHKCVQMHVALVRSLIPRTKTKPAPRAGTTEMWLHYYMDQGFHTGFWVGGWGGNTVVAGW